MKLQITGANGLALLAFQLAMLMMPCKSQYIPPKPIMRALYPRGVHFSIPDESGITLVAYHAKFNEDFNGLEAGTIARDIVRVKNGRWIYEDHTTRLKKGDVIYLWIHVIYDDLGYNLLDQILHVNEFYNYDGTPYRKTDSPTIPISPSPPSTPDIITNSTCYRSTTFHNGNYPCIGQLLFSEQFDQFDSTKWRKVKQFSGTPDYEFVVYQGNEENLKVKNGELHVKPTLLENEHDAQFIRSGNLILQDCTGQIGSEECEMNAQGYRILPPVSSGLIDTKRSFNFLYGRVQIRAKLPQGDWIYPVIKLLPVENTYGLGYRSGELRIADVIGNRELQDSASGMTWDGRLLRAGAVVSPEGPVRAKTLSKKNSSSYWGDDWHVYELEWTPIKISVKIDGEKYDEKENPAAAHRAEVFKNSADRWTSPNAPFDKSFYLSIGVAVGGLGQFTDDLTSGAHIKPWRNVETKALLNFYFAKESWANTWSDEASTLKVDYVKVWAL